MVYLFTVISTASGDCFLGSFPYALVRVFAFRFPGVARKFVALKESSWRSTMSKVFWFITVPDFIA